MKIALATQSVTGTAEGPNGEAGTITIPEGKFIANCSAEFKAGTWTIHHVATRGIYNFHAPFEAFQIREMKG
jgi:hypothetical protein